MSSTLRATASDKTMQNIVLATAELCLDKTEWKFVDLAGNQLPLNYKRLIGLKITLLKCTNPKGSAGRLLLCLVILSSWKQFEESTRAV